jgi:hypothetical protein
MEYDDLAYVVGKTWEATGGSVVYAQFIKLRPDWRGQKTPDQIKASLQENIDDGSLPPCVTAED